MFLGSVSGEILRYELDGRETRLPVFLDTEVLAASCRGVGDVCGYPSLAPAADRLWAMNGPSGTHLAVASTTCSSLVGARVDDGCFGLLDVGQAPIPVGVRPAIFGIHPSHLANRALVMGGSGTLFELLPREPVR